MKRFGILCALILLFAGLLTPLFAASKKLDKEAEAQLRALYKDKVRFQMLSGAAQMSLERKFGRKGKPVEVAIPDKPILPDLSPMATLNNVLVNNPAADASAQDTQSETAIVLAGPNIVASFNDSGSFNGTNNHFTGWSHSTDGGATWTDGGILPNSAEGDAGDPVLARNNTTGRVFLSTLGFNTGNVLQMFRSDNNGVSWLAPLSFGNTPGGAADQQDKEWIAVDNNVGAGQGNLYIVWRSFGDGIYFSRSTDGGATFSSSAKLVDQGTFNVQGPYVLVDPSHAIHVFWLDQSAGSGTANIIKTKKSTDQGTTFSSSVNVATLMTTGINGGLNLGGGFRTNAFPHADVNPVSGDLYVVWNDDVAGADKSDVFLSRSTDGGATWASATNISNLFDSSNNDDYSPSVAATPDGSKIIVAWYDRELDPNNNNIDYFGSIANVTSGVIFGPQFRITSQSFPPVIGQDPQINPVYMGDYDHIVADNANFHLTWGDNRSGNAFHANQPDVRYAKIPVTGPGAILTLNSSSVSDSVGNNNGNIDFNECLNLNVVLKNSGSSTASGVSATLQTSTPGVTVTTATSAYPDIAAGGSQTNTTPFQFETSPSFACGTPIQFTLDVTTSSAGPSGGASFSFSFTIQSGGLGATSQFDNNTSTPIADNSTVNIPFTVSGFSAPVGKVTLSLRALHTWAGDLDIILIGPDNTQVELSSDNGGSGDNYGTNCSPQSSRTTFDDAAATAISAGAAPFVGTFRPEGLLSSFNGKSGSNVNGTWTLKISDDATFDTGTFQCASLFLTAASCSDGGGGCSGTPPTCNYLDQFNDGNRTWPEVKPTVTEPPGEFLVLTPAGRKAIADSDPVFAGCQNCTITFDVQFSGGDVGSKTFLVTHKIDKTHRIDILIKLTQGKLVIKQKNGAVVAKAKGNFTFLPNTPYSITANYDGTDYEVRVNGTLVATLVPVGVIPSGILSVESKLQTTMVDRVCVGP